VTRATPTTPWSTPMMRLLKSPLHNAEGQNLVEFALIAPIMFLFLFGLIDFGMFLNHRIDAQHAVREGARYAAVHVGCTDIQNRTAERAGDLFDAAQVTVRYLDEDGAPVTSAAAGDTVEVSAPFSYNFSLISRFGIPGASGTVNVPASARLEMAVTTGGCGP